MKEEVTFSWYVANEFPSKLHVAQSKVLRACQAKALRLHDNDSTKVGETLASVVELLKQHGGYFQTFIALHTTPTNGYHGLAGRKIKRGKDKYEALQYRRQVAVLQFAWESWKATPTSAFHSQ